MPNILQNVLKTSGVGGEQPWKSFYKGIKPKNPLGGNIVRRMGNKVKPVMSSTNTKNMQFSHMDGLVEFKSDPNYIPPYRPLPGSPYAPQSIASPPYTMAKTETSEEVATKPILTTDAAKLEKRRRMMEKEAREQRRESRRAVADARATYRSGLDTAREVRNWGTTLGVFN